MLFKVTAAFDPEANVWYVQESNVPGLVTEADTREALFKKVIQIIPELIKLNRHEAGENYPDEVPVEFTTQHREMVRLAAA